MRALFDLHRSIGPQPRAIILAGAIWFWIGLGVATGLATEVVPGAWHTTLPIAFRVALWCGTGLIAAAVAMLGRGPRISLSLLTLGPVERFVSHIWSWAVTFLPGLQGDPRGWYIAGFYAFMVGAVWLFTYLPATPDGPSRRLAE